MYIVAALSGDCLAAELYVSPNGSDANSGSKQAPLATLHAARDMARKVKKADEPLTIFLREGTYYLGKTLVLGPDDSGTTQGPITYAACPGETAILSGGRRLDLQWTEYKNGVFQAPVPDADADFDQLFVDGKRQFMARYPNYDPAAKKFGGTAADAISPERVKRWANPAGGFVHALHERGWGGFHYRITGVDDKGDVTLEGGWQNNRRMGMHKKYRMVENIFEELDAPGEWYLDRAKGILYFMPPKGLHLDKARIEAAGLKRLVELRGAQEKPVRFVTFKNLTLTHAGRTFMEPYEPLLRSDWCIHRGGAVLLEGTEDCALADCFFDAVGGNAVFVSNYNRRAAVDGCKITEAGASAVCFVGDPKAVRYSADEYGKAVDADKLDKTPGPKTDNYPARCRVSDCLMHTFGVFEKQTAGVQIAMSEEITIDHCSIYDCPRAGINIGDGCWGGHVIEFCDVFDTVKETSDHGCFNSWGRDRFWRPDIEAVNRLVAKDPSLPFLDARKTTVLRNNRWRCDPSQKGGWVPWDIDLDDGSTNYLVTNNLCLSGGIKLREGYRRIVLNNVIVNNSLHPHRWYENSGDVFARNIVSAWYRPIGMPKVWGKEVDYNLLLNEADLKASRSMNMDPHGMAGDPMFVNPARGDYRVKEGSPALKLGFKNFPMDQFGVRKPKLRAEAGTPRLTGAPVHSQDIDPSRDAVHEWLGAKIKSVTNMGEVSSTGLGSETGVILLEVPEQSAAAKAGLRKMDVILDYDGVPINTAAELLRMYRGIEGEKIKLGVFRHQQKSTIEVPRKFP